MNIPLTPVGGGGHCINTDELQLADIIVSTTNARISQMIRAASGSVVSHAMIYARNNQVIEAIGDTYSFFSPSLFGKRISILLSP